LVKRTRFIGARQNRKSQTIKSFGYDENIYSTIIQDDDKIVLSGNTTSDLLVSRFNSNGEADLSFGVNGAVTTDFFDREFGRSSAIQKDGKILKEKMLQCYCEKCDLFLADRFVGGTCPHP